MTPHTLVAHSANLLDEVAARVCGDRRHLHGLPARALAHDVTVERVENALVRQLQRVEQQVLVARHLGGFLVAFLVGRAQLPCPHLRS